MAVEYAFETFFGTLHYFCMMCGSKWSQHSIDVFQRKLTAAVEHDFVGTARNILEDTKKHQKLMRKLNRLGGPPT